MLPSGDGVVHVVDAYKHVGTTICSEAGWTKEILARCSSGMSAYVPLASKVFGCQLLTPELRISLARSLVESRVFLHAGLWPQLPQTARARLEDTYLRPMRMIAGACKGAGVWKIPNEKILQDLGRPSLDNRLSAARLLFLENVLNRCPPSLARLLSAKGRDNAVIPWVAAVRADLQIMADRLGSKVSGLGHPTHTSSRWMHAIQSCPFELKELVALAVFCLLLLRCL